MRSNIVSIACVDFGSILLTRLPIGCRKWGIIVLPTRSQSRSDARFGGFRQSARQDKRCGSEWAIIKTIKFLSLQWLSSVGYELAPLNAS